MKKLSITALSLLTLTFASSAFAETPFTAEKPSVGAALKYGIYTGDTEQVDLNPYGVGLGVNGGYTLDMGLFVGGQFDYFFGESSDELLLGAPTEFSANVYQLMGVIGYDLGLTPELVLRPQLGVGLAFLAAEACFGDTCESESESKFAIAPGVKALYDVGPVYLSGEVSFNKVFTSDDDGDADAVVLGVGAGAKF